MECAVSPFAPPSYTPNHTAEVEWDAHGRMWVRTNNLYKFSLYVVDLNLIGLSADERRRMEETPEYAPCPEEIRHYRSVDVTKTLWDERQIRGQAPGPKIIDRWAQQVVLERYGDIRLSMVAGETNYSTPRMYRPDIDQYSAWECALFSAPGRTLDVLTGFADPPTKDGSRREVAVEWICPCGAGLHFACEKIGWECIARKRASIENCEERTPEEKERELRYLTGIAGYVPVEDIAWLQRQLAARRNLNVVLAERKKERQAEAGVTDEECAAAEYVGEER